MGKRDGTSTDNAKQTAPRGSLARAQAAVATCEAALASAVRTVGGLDNERRAAEGEVARLEVQAAQAAPAEVVPLMRALAAKRRALDEAVATAFSARTRVLGRAETQLAQARDFAASIAELARAAAGEVSYYEAHVTAAKARLVNVQRGVENELSLVEPRLAAARHRLAGFTGDAEGAGA